MTPEDPLAVPGKIIAVSTDDPSVAAAAPRAEGSVQPQRTASGGRPLADVLPIQVWTALPDGRLDWVNEHVTRYFGRSVAEMIGEGWQSYIHPEDLPKVVERWTRSLETAEPYEVLFRLRSAGDEYRWHIGRALPSVDEAGRVIEWHGSNTDIEDRFRVEEALRESERRFAFLSGASRDLASSLDYEETLRNVARLAVPAFADWCAVDLLDADGTLQRLAIEHVDRARVAFVQRLEERYPSDPNLPHGVMQVVRTGVAELAQDIPLDLLEELAKDAEHLAMLRELSLRSYIIVPIQGRHAVRGAMSFVYAESGRLYEERDIDFAQEVARRAGVAIENAELVRNLERTRTELEEQTTELEMQSEEMLVQTNHLEEQSKKLETSMTELQATADRLARSEALLAEAQSSAKLGSWEWDMATGNVVWTDELYRLYGYQPGEVAVDFAKYMERIHPDDRAVAHSAIEGALAEKGTFVFEHRVVRPDGGERFLHCRGRVVVDDDGRPVLMTGSAQDMTERKQVLDEITRAQEALGRANRTKSDFLASMSHELRTPLNAIGGHVELISLGIHGPVTPQQHASLERIRASQEHLLTLINDILQFAKLEAGHLEYRPKDVPVDDLVAGVVGMLEAQSRKRELTCVHRRASDELIVHADPDRVQQVLINLLGNALKFTDKGGSVTLSSERAGDTARVLVTDTGRGIPADRLGSIFDPFVQVRENLGDHPAGIGLGLAISRDLAREMGGDLTVESELGRGSTFTLVLPLA